MDGKCMGTKQGSFRETPEFLQGRNAEKHIAQLLQQAGWYVLPSYDYSGEDNNKAPRLQGLTRSLVIPDLDICQEGRRCWAEVKSKTKATWTRINQQWEHGIPRRHYDSYLEVQRLTGCKVWLFIYEEDTGDVLGQELDSLTPRFYAGEKMSPGGMVFFRKNQFLPWKF